MKDQTHRLFHQLWTADVGTEGYDKKRWIEMETYLNRSGAVDKRLKSPESQSGEYVGSNPTCPTRFRFYDSE